MKQEWHFTVNQFDNNTKKSRKLMNIINGDHIARLQAEASDPDINHLLSRTLPMHDAFNDAYSAWVSANAEHEGSTNAMENMFDVLTNDKTPEWDIAIQGMHLAGTSQYKTLLPDRRKPLQSGGYEARLIQVKALGERLGDFPALAAVKVDVDNYYYALKTQRDLQQQKEELVDQKSTVLETARVELAVMMYRNVGALIDKFGETPERISNFWELKHLVDHSAANHTEVPEETEDTPEEATPETGLPETPGDSTTPPAPAGTDGEGPEEVPDE